MIYLSLILSIAILFFVINRMYLQRRFDWLNGIIIAGALIVVLLDLDTVFFGREYQVTSFISLAILVLYLFNLSRKNIDNEE